ncbi:MAG: prolyl oligopeptidase family serine peptidase [Paludibacter sp.]|nr:prolyl oligopeptidase family serine peptidase [Paludibacter sp.]
MFVSQENLNYQLPPEEILQLADYQRLPSIEMDVNNKYLLYIYRNTYKTLEDINQPEIKLAGKRINPVASISSKIDYIRNLKVALVDGGVPVQVSGLPENPRIAYLTWSRDDSKIAFTNTVSNGLELWVLDFETASAKKLTDARVNAFFGNPICWFADNQHILIKLLPEKRANVTDALSAIPAGPVISESDGTKSHNRTYQDLLKNKRDEDNFVALATSEYNKLDLNGNKVLFKESNIYKNENISPDGKCVMISIIRKPFSFLVPEEYFAKQTIVCDSEGNTVKVVNEVPLLDSLPKGFMAVQKEKRRFNWRSDEPATLAFVEALDGGDPAIETEFRDAIYTWKAPFVEAPELRCKTNLRFSSISWCNADVAVVEDYWYDTRQAKTYLINPSKPSEEPKIIFERNYQDVYAFPGNFEVVKNIYGKYSLAIENDCIFLTGPGHTPQGQFPFIDRFDTKTIATERIYQSAFTDKIEEIYSFEHFVKGDVLVRIQSPAEYPNYFIRNIKNNTLKQLTHFENPFESINTVQKELVKYKRSDGVELTGTLYLPAGYHLHSGKKLPLLIWAYPAEYKDKDSASQTTANPNEFTFPHYSTFVYWVTRGYAVLDDAAFPIVGEGKTEPNDNFIEQLIDNARAAIDAVDALGYIDRKKVGVGGHSYGAFMVANLLTYCELFACGVARSGAYNRTLTPFGFQSEQRNYWEAPEIYNSLSPFMNAHKMITPLLLVHGEEDNNSGTFTLQTERYFQALKGLGAPARMVILPKESHGYVARENIMHLLWEQDRFFEKYLK